MYCTVDHTISEKAGECLGPTKKGLVTSTVPPILHCEKEGVFFIDS